MNGRRDENTIRPNLARMSTVLQDLAALLELQKLDIDNLELRKTLGRVGCYVAGQGCRTRIRRAVTMLEVFARAPDADLRVGRRRLYQAC